MQRARRELAATAVRLFEERGFGEVTVEEIAEAADYSASTFYRQFGTKEDAVFYDIADRMGTYEQLLDTPKKPPSWEAIRAVLLDNAAYWEESDPEFARARTRLFLREPSLYRRYLMACDEIETLLTQAFAIARGTRPQADVWCEVISGAAVAAWRAGFSKWLDSGGALRDHIAAGLDVIDPIAQPGASRQRKHAA